MDAWCDPTAEVVLIDPSVPPEREHEVLIEIGHELLGNHDLAPHVIRPRPALTVLEGGRDAG